MRILIAIDSMHDGGAARVVSVLANQLAEFGHSIYLGTNLTTRPVSYELHKNITLFNIYSANHASQNKLGRLYSHVSLIRNAINKYNIEVVIGQMENALLYCLLATIGKNIPVIGHRHTSFHILGIRRDERIVYNWADACVLLNKVDSRWLGDKIKNKYVIYNPCTYPIIDIPQNKREKVIAVVGSLERWEQKGFDIMLDIWKDIEKKYPDWQLKIVGGGLEERVKSIRDYAGALGVSRRVIFTGYTKKVNEILQNASIYALPSRLEGFPMTLVEAVSQGCACVAFELDGLIPEIYSEKAVLPVPDGDKTHFTNVLERLMNDENLREEMRICAQREILQYSSQNIGHQWERLFNKLVKK